MKFQFFSVLAMAPENGQQALNTFCGKHRVVSVDKQLIVQGSDSFWSVCVSYIDGVEGEITGSPKISGKRGRVDYKEVLGEEDFNAYAELRNLRKTLVVYSIDCS